MDEEPDPCSWPPDQGPAPFLGQDCALTPREGMAAHRATMTVRRYSAYLSHPAVAPILRQFARWA